MNFSLSAVISGLQQGLSLVQTMAPLATAVGAPPGLVEKVTNIAGAVLDTAQNVSQRVEEGAIVATSNDQQQLKDIVASIQRENDELDRFIDAN